MNYHQLQWTIAHDPCKEGDRTPAGAVAMGTAVDLFLRVDESARELIAGAQLLLGEPTDEDPCTLSWTNRDMTPCLGGYRAEIRTADHPCVELYAFAIDLSNGARAYYTPRKDGRSTAGELHVDGFEGAPYKRVHKVQLFGGVPFIF